jgi:oligopeptide transport system permease protein
MAVTTATTTLIKPNRRASPGSIAWHRFLKRKSAVVALCFVLFQVFVAIFAAFFAPYDPYYSDYSQTYQPPSREHWMGTDDLGRDVFSRVIYGTRVSYAVGVLSQIAIVIIGLPIGAFSALVGGGLDYAVMRIVDIISSVPGLLLYILLMVALGAGLQNMILAMAVTGWIGITRLVRGQVLTLKESDFVRAATAMGANTNWITRKHIIRNTLSVVIVAMTLGVPGAMFAEAGLSFLGLGISPPTPSWGQMIGIYQSSFRIWPWLVLWPAIVLAITMLAWIIMGDGVRDAMDPNIRM